MDDSQRCDLLSRHTNAIDAVQLLLRKVGAEAEIDEDEATLIADLLTVVTGPMQEELLAWHFDLRQREKDADVVPPPKTPRDT